MTVYQGAWWASVAPWLAVLAAMLVGSLIGVVVMLAIGEPAWRQTVAVPYGVILLALLPIVHVHVSRKMRPLATCRECGRSNQAFFWYVSWMPVVGVISDPPQRCRGCRADLRSMQV